MSFMVVKCPWCGLGGLKLVEGDHLPMHRKPYAPDEVCPMGFVHIEEAHERADEALAWHAATGE